MHARKEEEEEEERKKLPPLGVCLNNNRLINVPLVKKISLSLTLFLSKKHIWRHGSHFPELFTFKKISRGINLEI